MPLRVFNSLQGSVTSTFRRLMRIDIPFPMLLTMNGLLSQSAA